MNFLAGILCILGSIGAIAFIIALAIVLDGGCLSIVIGLASIVGYIVGNVHFGGRFGAPGVAIFNLVGIILGIIAIKIIKSDSGSSSSYSSSRRSSFSASNWAESRKNSPHTCGNCTKYSSTNGECRLSGNPKSAEDSCSSWC
jgi:hypothetical protein